jgi:hypothetical protein
VSVGKAEVFILNLLRGSKEPMVPSEVVKNYPGTETDAQLALRKLVLTGEVDILGDWKLRISKKGSP